MPNANLTVRALQNSPLSAVEDRLVQTILCYPGVIGVGRGSFEVKQDTGANLAIKVGSGTAYDRAVVGGSQPGQGNYIVEHQNSAETLNLAPSHSTNNRLDLVVLRVYDDEWDGSGSDYADIEVIEGTPAAVPEAPEVPDGAIPLALVEVAANATAITDDDITDLREEAPVKGQLVKTLYFEALGGFPGVYQFQKADYPWLRAVRVKVQGGGGGGGACEATTGGNSSLGAGGGGGGYAEKFIPVEDLQDTETIEVGAGGRGGSAGNLTNQTDGGDSHFGNHCTGFGGSAAGTGLASNNTDGSWAYEGAGGLATGGDINIPGSAGGRAIRISGQNVAQLGYGGGSYLASPQMDWNNSGSAGPGTSGRPYGGGGAGAYARGASGVANAGGNGADGIVIVELYA